MIDRALELTLSMGTLTTCYFVGNKHKVAPYMGAVLEALWTVYSLKLGLYGLLPMNIGLLILYIRMIYKWK